MGPSCCVCLFICLKKKNVEIFTVLLEVAFVSSFRNEISSQCRRIHCVWVSEKWTECVLNFCSLISLAVRLCLHMQKGFHINISPNLRSKWTYVFNFFLSFRSCCCFPASFFHRPMALDICVRHRWVGKKATRRTMFNIVIYTLFWSNWPYIVELYFICCYIC